MADSARSDSLAADILAPLTRNIRSYAMKEVNIQQLSQREQCVHP